MKDDIEFVIKALKKNIKIWNLIKEEEQKDLLQNTIFKTFLENNDEMKKIIKNRRGFFGFLY